MSRYVALFRGVNVSGKNSMPMLELRRMLESLGASSVKTYLQSGNAVLTHTDRSPSHLKDRIESAVLSHFGFQSSLLLLSPKELLEAIATSPFAKEAEDPKSVHLCILTGAPRSPDLAALSRLQSETERYFLRGRYFYLHAPDGVGRSRLAKGYEKSLGVTATARNWRTIAALGDLVR